MIRITQWSRGERVTAVLIAALVVVTTTLLMLGLRHPLLSLADNARLLLVYFLTLCAAEQLRVRLPGRMTTSPMATSVALAMALTPSKPGEGVATYDAGACILVAAAAMLMSAPVNRPVEEPRRFTAVDNLARLLLVAIAALAARDLPLIAGDTLVVAFGTWPGWQSALVMLVIGSLAALTEGPIRATRRAADDGTPWVRTVRDEVATGAGLVGAMVVTGVCIAVSVPALGAVAVPLLMLPLSVTQLATTRHAAIRTSYRETIDALSRMPEVAGFVPRGHASRVAALCVAIGRDLGLPEKDVLELETAGLLHDIGQLHLRTAIPAGATVQAAPADQQRIATYGAGIVRETGVLDAVADVLDVQAVPYHRMVQHRIELPLASRIIKVANAYDDYGCGGGRSARPAQTEPCRDVALERIYLGLGYEFDPGVVASLARVTARGEGG